MQGSKATTCPAGAAGEACHQRAAAGRGTAAHRRARPANGERGREASFCRGLGLARGPAGYALAVSVKAFRGLVVVALVVAKAYRCHAQATMAMARRSTRSRSSRPLSHARFNSHVREYVHSKKKNTYGAV